MYYQSTRGKYSRITAAEAIKIGISPDGGLFVPDYIPHLDATDFQELGYLNYQERACRIFAKFLSDFTAEEIQNCVHGAYNAVNFDHEKIAPLVNLSDNLYIQELWHGPTCAFKDMALQILPHLLTTSAHKTGETSEIVILVATSGDTGKAALEGFKDVDGTRIIVFFPEDGVSEIQKRQMITQEGKNVHVAAVKGNFDDAQNGVKNIFTSQAIIATLLENNIKMSSANSINWGRLLPQIVYYISAYVDLQVGGKISQGDAINIVVPTGNFGNILAAYYASQMGVPVNKLICASNANNVLTDFIKTGRYDRNRKFHKTISPSMDILISSNLERLLYELTDHDASIICRLMQKLSQEGVYEVEDAIQNQLEKLFWADFATDEETIATIKSTWKEKNYLLDTHTAVARNVYAKYLSATGDRTPAIIASTASPFKFGSSVARAVLSDETIKKAHNEFELLKILSAETGLAVPSGLRDLDQKEIKHTTISSKENLAATVLNFLDIK
ncbi:MAG: threonine synthase [Syntrophomonadaceae bacterium]|nr:threonine synthase [Syntrophomonadaceae bacterium]